MDLKPAVVTPELAAAALASPALSAAVKLAEWVGDGREIAGSGVLRPAAAAEACAYLGIAGEDKPKKLRSAQDVPELMAAWDVGRAAGLITVDSKHATGLTPGGPTATLDAWLTGITAAYGPPDDLCPECLTVLAAIAQAGDAPITVLDVVVKVLGGLPMPASCPDCGEIHENPDVAETGIHTAEALKSLEHFGAVALDGNGGIESAVTLTPLGQMLADSVFAVLAPAPEDKAIDVAKRLAGLPGPTSTRYAADWLAARTPAGAVTQLLDAAESATPRQRLTAIDLAQAIGPEATPVWQERSQAPGYGAHIRAVLAASGEDVPNFPRDDAWLAADDMSAAFEIIAPEHALTQMRLDLEDDDPRQSAADLLARLGDSGHPDAPRLIELVRAASKPRPPLPGAAKPLQLMITLQGVDDPPVWRRVAVPGSMTLADLHYVIQDAMGWDNGHMHTFYAGRRELAGTSVLRDVLPRSRSSFQYIYDFGDDWTHDIKSEGFFTNDIGAPIPACLDGSGACPPEECGGASGYYYLKETLADPEDEEHAERLWWLGLDSAEDFDPAAFDVAEANARLHPSPQVELPDSPPVTVIRVQRRTKKKAKSKR